MNRRRHRLLTALSGLLLGSAALAQSGQNADGTWTLRELRDPSGTARFGGLDAPTLRLLGTEICTAAGSGAKFGVRHKVRTSSSHSDMSR